jgi:drug/metabolite transporter (DMT)-like permease
MPTDVRQVVTLFLFFLGIALCMWRTPRGDRWHVALCLSAAVIWSGVALFEPRTRTLGFGVVVGSFLALGLFKALQGRAARL